MKKTWTEKLNDAKGLPKVEPIEGKMQAKWGCGTVAIPAPIEVFGLMKNVPKGKLTTINEIRKHIAIEHKASIGCPITCGIFAWISANAAEEIARRDKEPPMAYWRTLKSDGSINDKYPGGLELQRTLLENEGFEIITKGKRLIVKNFDKYLAHL